MNNVVEREYNIPVTNTSKPIYDLIYGNIGIIQKKAEGKELVIYGAGVRGRLIAKIMDESNIGNVLFCDQNPMYIGSIINGHRCIGITEMYEEIDKYFIVISPENAKEIVKSCEERGLKNDINFVQLGGTLYKEFIEQLQKKQTSGVLVLGDCDFLACSLLEEEKSSLGEKLQDVLYKEIKGEGYKQLAMNAMTLAGFYWTYKTNKTLGNSADYVFITIDMRNFNGITNRLPNAQHVDLLEEMEQLVYIDGFHDYINDAREYAKQQQGEVFNKTWGKDEKRQKINGNYIKLNYCYRIKECNQEILYLCRLLEQISADNSKAVLLFMPINFELAIKYCPDKFEVSFNENKQKLLEIISKYNAYVIDFSWLMNSKFYLDKETYDECLSNEGKNIIVKELFEEYVKIRGKEI